MIDLDVNCMYPHVLNFEISGWNFTHNNKRARWEAYKNPAEWNSGIISWLYTSFGEPGRNNGSWDHHGGWLYIYSEEALVIFKLRWI